MRTKRGQQAAAAGAAVLLAIIAGLLIMFIILMPPEERAELLGEEVEGVPSEDLGDTVIKENLLRVTPGRIDYLAQKEVEHPLPVISVYTRTESKVLAEKNVAYAKKGVFTEEVSEFSFSIPDLEHTENVILSLKPVLVKGRMMVTLNDEVIYNSEVAEGSIKPISLHKNYLRAENRIIFAVSSPGVAIWQTNELSLENIKVVADVTGVEAQTSKNTFLVSETEKKNLEKVILKFVPDCEYGEVGKLSIIVNEHEIYNAVPDCAIDLVPIEFAPELVNQGENEIVFYTERGVYMLSHVLIKSYLEEVDFPTYYFELSHENYEAVQNEEKQVRLKMSFVDVVALKKGDLVFNGHIIRFDTKEVSYIVDVGDDVVQGNNAVKIRPKKTLEVRELRVDLIN